MKTMKVTILGVELEAALLNPKVAKKYADGIKDVARKANEAVKCGTIYEEIEMQCNAVIDFLNDNFGRGSAVKVLGEETDLISCLEAFRDISNVYKTQVSPYAEEVANQIMKEIEE